MTGEPSFDPGIPQRLAADPRRSVWVGASAGTGKTKVLTDRVLGLLLSGTAPHRLLCLTFTKAAAAEMANRINARLAEWAALSDQELAGDLERLLGRKPTAGERFAAPRLFAQVLDAPGGLRIETIHAFCQAVLRRFPLEAGLAPHFAVMDERDAAGMLADARDQVLAAAQVGADPALKRAIEVLTLLVREEAFLDLLSKLVAERGRLIRLRSHFGGFEGARAAIAQVLGVDPARTTDDVIDDACADQAFDVEGCRAAARAMIAKGNVDKGEVMADWLADGETRAGKLALWRAVFLTGTGTIRKSLCAQAVEKAFPGTTAIMITEAERLLRLDVALRAVATFQATDALLIVADALLAAFERRKASAAMLDYDDLILAVRRLLEQDGGAAWVLYKLDGGIDHVLIDEAQDTNPDQWAVVQALTDEFFAGRGRQAEGKRTVFAVGDAKQSIYSFQRADPAEFERMRRLLSERVPQANGLWNEVALDVSFRSTKAVLQAVDLVLNSADGRVGVAQPGEVIAHRAWRAKAGGMVELWPPVSPREGDERDPWKPPVERVGGDSPRRRLARLVAARIGRMLTGEQLESAGRAIRPGDIMVLVRRRNAFVEELVRELKALSVPVAGTDRMVLTEQLAVMDLMALGNALLLPADDLTLAVVLKSPLVGLAEEDLFTLAWNRKASLYDALRARRDEPPFAAAWARLRDWMALAGRASPHDFFAAVLNQGGRSRLLARLGPEADDPIDEFMSQTLAFERQHPPSLQGFLAWMSGGGVEIKRDLETGGDMVRIMTVHGAKGLQAPIVFLPDTLQAPVASPSLFWKNHDGCELPIWAAKAADLDDVALDLKARAAEARDREYRRLLYVAMTRAEDRLIVCGWKTRRAPPEHCWHRLIEKALEGTAARVEDAFLKGRSEIDGAEILRLVSPQMEPPKDKTAQVPSAAPDPLPPWALIAPEREAPLTRPLSPSRPDGEAPAPRSPLQSDPADRVRFLRGKLIHRLLQVLPEIARDKRSQAAARFLGRPAWGLSARERTEIAIEVAGVLDDPDWSALFGPGSRAEVPVVGTIGERAVSGQIDRLVVTATDVLIVDYKTNRLPPPRVEDVSIVYLRQLAAYRALIADIYPGRRIRCALLWTETPKLMPVDGAILDDHLAGLPGESSDPAAPSPP